MLPIALISLLTCLPLSVDTPPQRGDVQWFEGTLEEALAEARSEKRLVVLEFWADWSDWCTQHETDNLHDPEVVAALSEFVCISLELSVDEEGNFLDKQAEALMRRFAVRRFPTLICLRPDGTPEDLVSGFYAAPTLLMELGRIRAGDLTVSYYERQVALEPLDLEWRYKLALKLDDLGDVAGYRRELDTIVARDPEGVSLPRRRMALGQLREHLWGCMRDPEIEPDPADLEVFLAHAQYPELQSDGWLLMGAVRTELGDASGSREAYKAAWKYVPAGQRPSVGNGIAWNFWVERADLSEQEKQWALTVAQESTKAFELTSCDPVALAQYVDTLACCHYMVGDREEAIRQIERCIELDPDTAVAFEEHRALFE